MKYNFNGIFDEKMYESAQVILVTGPYSGFVNMVCDNMKSRCGGELEVSDSMDDFLSEFGMSGFSSSSGRSDLSYDMFLDVVNSPSLTGRWFCRVDWKELTNKQRKSFVAYAKHPSPYGCLVVTSGEYGDYREFLRSSLFKNSLVTHLIQTSFPNRVGLQRVVRETLEKYGAKATEEAIQTFILRMSNSYDEYEDMLTDIAKQYQGKTINRADMTEALKGVENYVLDDFIRQLTVQVNNTRLYATRKVYKILRVMLDDMGAIALTKKLRRKIDEAIEMRLLINQGIVPVRIRYSVEEVKKRIPDDNKLKGMNDYSFKRLADVAGLTSLRDWVFMKLILSTPKTAYREDEYERALLALVNRTAFSSDRLENIVGIRNNLELRPEIYQALMREQFGEQIGQEVPMLASESPKKIHKVRGGSQAETWGEHKAKEAKAEEKRRKAAEKAAEALEEREQQAAYIQILMGTGAALG